jgi:hypothetical protein
MTDRDRTNPLEIQIVFRDPDGQKTKGPVFRLSGQRARQWHDDAWDKDDCIQQLRESLHARESDGVQAAMRAMDRLQCWPEAIRELISGPPDELLGNRLLWWWVSYGFHVGASLGRDLVLFVDGLKRFLPPYSGSGVTLYRGEALSRYEAGLHGLSWTPERAVARMFANRRLPLGDGPGVVLEINANSEVIVAAVERTSSGRHTTWLGEREYILDPRRLCEIRSRE